MTTNPVASSHLQSLWSSNESTITKSSWSSWLNFSSQSYESSARTVNWIVENRGGMAYATGLLMVPSQFLSPKASEAGEIIDQACELGKERNQFKVILFEVTIENTDLEGLIYYPKDYDLLDVSHCVLYHNPNGITVAEYFEYGILSQTPARIVELEKCPIILYDYRGTGRSSDNTSSSSLAFRPTYASILADGEGMLENAFHRFRSVKVIGSSLGGGVATISSERYLQNHPEKQKKISLWNHDSFSTTPRVVMPKMPMVADYIGWASGGLLDAEKAMKSLIDRNIPITVLCHLRDPVIPEGARIAESIAKLPDNKNVRIIYSLQYGHANLSGDMIQALKKPWN